jgi:hypothetical protein
LFIHSLVSCSTLTQVWIFGTAACKLLSALKGVNGYVSVLTMVLMSVDRYLAVVYPLSSLRYRTVRNATAVCLAVWVACALIMTPYWIYAGVGGQTGSERRKYKCEITWPRESERAHRWFWANFELVVGFVLPVLISGVCYARLLQSLARHGRTSGGAGNQPQSPGARPLRKVTLMVFTVTAVFVVCWTPYHVVSYSSALKSIANAGRLSGGVEGVKG